ncbi:hypothetical protein [Streptomyces mirabilis]|uniref:hypothetical protein n=1 Tax=Streptomyces mirabilis TaxID=68239 RepID=UPI003F4B7D29
MKPQVKGLVCARFGVLGLVHGFAHLKNWRVLGKVRIDPKWATALVRALLFVPGRGRCR